MRTLFILLTISTGTVCCVAKGPSSIILYEKVGADNQKYLAGLAIDEERQVLRDYTPPFDAADLELERDFGSAAFRYRKIEGITYDPTTKISLPDQLYSNAKWSYKDISCNAVGNDAKYEITCLRRDRVWKYVYSAGRGVTEFEFPCSDGPICSYKLKTEVGIFHQK
ncbi:MAG: hypothetical protein P8J20_06285 [Novosphingobium sp.]|nr:hypothetical protein [Novosphingobium sp.]